MRLVVPCLLALALAGCSITRRVNYRTPNEVEAATVDLQLGMEPAAVEAILGKPDGKAGELCGGGGGGTEWKCVIWMYRTSNEYRRLLVVFEGGSTLAVNSWRWL